LTRENSLLILRAVKSDTLSIFTLPVFFERGFTKENIISSLEMRMKCGIGKCGRCNVGSKYVCKDGPVFLLAELDKLILEY
jgi:hypothetical protein